MDHSINPSTTATSVVAGLIDSVSPLAKRCDDADGMQGEPERQWFGNSDHEAKIIDRVDVATGGIDVTQLEGDLGDLLSGVSEADEIGGASKRGASELKRLRCPVVEEEEQRSAEVA
jgi:hypothetical protein